MNVTSQSQTRLDPVFLWVECYSEAPHDCLVQVKVIPANVQFSTWVEAYLYDATLVRFSPPRVSVKPRHELCSALTPMEGV